ncbi:MAG: hypothetical protein AAF413_04590 [Patescibacteria group bacterium]
MSMLRGRRFLSAYFDTSSFLVKYLLDMGGEKIAVKVSPTGEPDTQVADIDPSEFIQKPKTDSTSLVASEATAQTVEVSPPPAEDVDAASETKTTTPPATNVKPTTRPVVGHYYAMALLAAAIFTVCVFALGFTFGQNYSSDESSTTSQSG